MNSETAHKLNQMAYQVSQWYSNPNRDRNFNQEVFEVYAVEPLSEYTAIVTYLKSSQKKALAFFYYVNVNGGEWRYFFPSDSHILGMEMFGRYKQEVEIFNFPKSIEVHEE